MTLIAEFPDNTQGQNKFRARRIEWNNAGQEWGARLNYVFFFVELCLFCFENSVWEPDKLLFQASQFSTLSELTHQKNGQPAKQLDD